MSDYIIIHGQTVYDVEDRVRAAVANGYEPTGGVVFEPPSPNGGSIERVHQAMFKRTVRSRPNVGPR